MFLIIYPIIKTIQTLKKPRVAQLKHWLFFWILYTISQYIFMFTRFANIYLTWIPSISLFVYSIDIVTSALILGSQTEAIYSYIQKVILHVFYRDIKKTFKHCRLWLNNNYDLKNIITNNNQFIQKYIEILKYILKF